MSCCDEPGCVRAKPILYRAGVDRDTDEQVAVAFTPEMGRLIVVALNALVGGDPDA